MVEEAIFVHGGDLPLLKRAIAKTLYGRKIEQSKISEMLNLSQPMVSNYCSSDARISHTIMELAGTIADTIINGSIPAFHTCVSFSDKRIEGKFYIAKKNEVNTDETNAIIDNLTEAFLLLKGNNVGRLLPKVKINIALAKEDAASPEDVAAFLNGLVVVDDKVSSINGIRFGKSKHLPSLLLYLKDNLDINAIMNIAYLPNIEKSRFSHSYLNRDFKLLETVKHVDILLHKGDFGIEPCAYILGKDAIDVAKKFLIFLEEVTNDRL